VIPWARVLALTEPHYPRTDQSCQPVWLERILRIYFLQRWFNLSDPQAEDALYDSESMRRFVAWNWATIILLPLEIEPPIVQGRRDREVGK
jgi:hypothetical protein